MLKKLRISAIVLILVLLSACVPRSSEDRSKSRLDQGMSSDSQIEITLWDYFFTADRRTEALETLIYNYQRFHPNVKIKRITVPFGDMVNKLLLSSATGELPDLILVDNPYHQMFAAAGMLEDISERVEVWGEKDLYFSEAWASNEYKGKVYGIPMGSNNLALYYNADLLHAAGLKPPSNWDELKDAARKLTKPGVYGFQVTAVHNEQTTYSFLPFLWQSGSDLMNFDSPGTVEAVKLWKEMVDNGTMSKDILHQDLLTTNSQFASGHVAMMVNGGWMMEILEKEATFKWGVVNLPKNKKEATVLGGENWAITSTSKQKDTAWDFIRFSQEEENLKEFLLLTGRIPARKDLIRDPAWQSDPNRKVFVDSMNITKSRAFGSNYPEISKVMQGMIQQVVRGYLSPEDAVKEAGKKIRLLLTKN
ncbi:sugar ABC transporter substrate-binding protein [Ammoniphilus sp. 3BR4]|uniref:ABC transporter substrate-binding protein n=1 Tax=Ammoniphilus sp. 3BR4 TaxID=3158265 RepID=UPI0034654575